MFFVTEVKVYSSIETHFANCNSKLKIYVYGELQKVYKKELKFCRTLSFKSHAWIYFLFDVTSFFVFEFSKNCFTVRLLKDEGSFSPCRYYTKMFTF